jgi:hypothetical protein
MSNTPKWSTPIRRACLVKLWEDNGNKCLFGHPVCANPSHYLYRQAEGVKVAEPAKLRCVDSHGNPLNDKDGNPLYLTVYAVKTETTYKLKATRLYERISEAAIAGWIADDRQNRQAEWQAESRRLHGLSERAFPLRGQFSAISKDIFYSSQPDYYLSGISIDGLTFRPFAKIRLASEYVYLYVSLGDTLRKVSKNKRRKAVRYGKPLPASIEAEITRLCNLAVRDCHH